MSDEELRRDLRRVMIRAEREWPGNLERRLDEVLAVFREHTAPTDEDRDTLIALRLASYSKTMSDGYPSSVVRSNEEAADIVIEAGFRRGAPTGDERDRQVAERAWDEGFDAGQAWESDVNSRTIPQVTRWDNPHLNGVSQ